MRCDDTVPHHERTSRHWEKQRHTIQYNTTQQYSTTQLTFVVGVLGIIHTLHIGSIIIFLRHAASLLQSSNRMDTRISTDKKDSVFLLTLSGIVCYAECQQQKALRFVARRLVMLLLSHFSSLRGNGIWNIESIGGTE
jgi:hypothetical protein